MDIMLTSPESTELNLILNIVTILAWRDSILASSFYKVLIFIFFTLTVVLQTYLNFKLPLNPPESKQGLNYKQIVLIPFPWSLLVRSSPKSMTDTLLLSFRIEFPKA